MLHKNNTKAFINHIKHLLIKLSIY